MKLNQPRIKRRRSRLNPFNPRSDFNVKTPPRDLSGRISETIAHFLGTPAFIFWLTIFCILWLSWNTLAPDNLRFDSSDLGFTALTLILSLQASYAAPLILFAQNRQADRERVSMERDRERTERNLADTEYLAHEIASIRLSISELASETATRDFVRQELKTVLSEVLAEKTDKADKTDKSNKTTKSDKSDKSDKVSKSD